jgi:hypothetical protein
MMRRATGTQVQFCLILYFGDSSNLFFLVGFETNSGYTQHKVCSYLLDGLLMLVVLAKGWAPDFLSGTRLFMDII